MYVVACGQFLGPAPDALHPSVSDPVLQAINLSRFIRLKIHEFNVKNHVSLSVHVGTVARPPDPAFAT